MVVEVANVQETRDIQRKLDGLPDDIETAQPQAQIPYPPHVFGALGDDNLRKMLAFADLGIIDALAEDGEEKGHEDDLDEMQEIGRAHV